MDDVDRLSPVLRVMKFSWWVINPPTTWKNNSRRLMISRKANILLFSLLNFYFESSQTKYIPYLSVWKRERWTRFLELNGAISIIGTHECMIAMCRFEDFAFFFTWLVGTCAVGKRAESHGFASKTWTTWAHAGQDTAGCGSSWATGGESGTASGESGTTGGQWRTTSGGWKWELSRGSGQANSKQTRKKQ